MPSTSNDFFVLVWMLNWNWTYIVKEFLLKDCQEQCFLQIFIGRLSEAEFPQNFCWVIVGSSVSFKFLLEDCQRQSFLKIFVGRLSGAVFPSNFYWKIVRGRVSLKFLLEDCREQCFLQIFIGRLSGAVFPSNFCWKIVGSSVSFEFVLEDCREQCFLQIFMGRLSWAVFPSNLYWKMVGSRFSFEFFVCENSVRCKTRLVFRKTEETVSYLLTLKKFRMQSKFRDEANLVSWKQRIYIYKEETATPLVFTTSVFCLRKPEAERKTTPEWWTIFAWGLHCMWGVRYIVDPFHTLKFFLNLHVLPSSHSKKLFWRKKTKILF